MKHFFTILAALLGFISCNRNFTTAEREVIFRGDGDVMQVMSIANQSDSLLLRSRSQLVSEDMVATEEFKTLCSRMLATVQSPEHDGVGIAAPQVGILRRVVLVDTGEEILELINPEIIYTEGEQTGPEGCLSVPGKYAPVERPNYVKAKAMDRDGNEFIIEGEELMARALCHEIDHLDGILYIDKALPVEE